MVAATANRSHLCSKSGKSNFQEVCAVQTPSSTETYEAMPYGVFLNMIQEIGGKKGLDIDMNKAVFGLNRGGQRMFGCIDLDGYEHMGKSMGISLGFRASHDKSMRCDVCFGTRVFVCDNMAFTAYSGEGFAARKIYHKHTGGIDETLPIRISDAFDAIPDYIRFHEEFYGKLKDITLENTAAYATIVRAMRAEAINNNDIPAVADEWDYQAEEPKIITHAWHPEFQERTALSLFNAFTEIHKDFQDKNPVEASKRSIRLNEFFYSEFVDSWN